MNIYPWAKKLNWDLIRKALNDKPREGFELLQMDLAALEKMAGSGRRGWEGKRTLRVTPVTCPRHGMTRTSLPDT